MLPAALWGPFMGSYPNASFDFFPYAGLHRPVILVALPQTYIRDVTVVTDIVGQDGLVKVTVQQHGTAKTGKVSLNGGEVSADLVFAGDTATATLSVPQAKLWSTTDPYLYDLAITLNEGETVLDRYSLDIGIRTIAVQGKEVLLNGEPVFLKGFGKHEDFPIAGRGQFNPLITRDYSLLKWVGANSYRTSHYPYSEEQMMLADREGILIIDEIPAVGLFFDDGPDNVQTRLEMCQQQLRELIRRDKNHACVIMWSVANEPFPPDMIKRFMGGEIPPTPPETTAFFENLVDLSRELDPTRLVTLVGIHGCPEEWLALSDVVLINRYYGWYTQGGQMEMGVQVLEKELDDLYANLGKPILISEFGADTVAGTHSNPPEMFSEEYQVEFLREYLALAARKDYMVGMHVWNFADFKTGQGTRRVGGLNLKGVFTRDRRPKMAAHFLRERWAE